jgi:hypothetical protein
MSLRNANIKVMAAKISKGVKVLEKKIAVNLVILMQREEGLGDWDLVISSPQLSTGRIDSYDIVVKYLVDILDANERMAISRVVIMEETDPSTQYIMMNLPFIEHSAGWGCKSSDLNVIADYLGFDIRNAFLIRNLTDSNF